MTLRVALLNFAFWPEVQRGSERIVHDLAVDLNKLGHEPRIITSHPGPRSVATEDGVQIVRNRRPPDAPLRLRKFQDQLTHVPFSYLTLRNGDDQVAHGFYPTDALASTRWGRETGRPAVFSYMGIPARSVTAHKRQRMRILEYVTQQSAAVVGLSRTACDELWRWWGVDPVLIYPGVELDAFQRVRGERADVPTIACGASPDDQRKQVPLLVEAFERVRRSRPDARLLLMRPSNQRLETELTRDGVEFYEPSPHAVADVFAQAWTSALASRDEAFGLVVVESLATGTPVVAANQAGPAEILDRDGVGVLFDDWTPESVAAALTQALELSSDPSAPDTCRARAADFTSERCAREHEQLYTDLLAR